VDNMTRLFVSLTTKHNNNSHNNKAPLAFC